MTRPKLDQIGMASHLSSDQWATLCGVCSQTVSVKSGTVLSHRGHQLDKSLLLMTGLIGRTIPMDGSSRSHFVAIEVPGDFVDFHAFPLKKLDHDVVAMTDTTVAVFNHSDLSSLIQRDAALARVLWGLTLVDASIHRQWAFRNGTMRAMTAVANLLCELDTRLMNAGLAGDSEIAFPLTQRDLADACGLTVEHTNRVMKDLREDGCCAVVGTRLQILDRDRLQRTGKFEPDYLYLPDRTKLSDIQS